MTVIFTSCARVEVPKLPANYFYEGSYIDIHSPNQEGWFLASKSRKEMIFGKYGTEKGSSFIANVIFFPLPKEPKDKNEFLSLIKKGAKQNIDKNRFDKIKSNFILYEKRKYMCVMARSLVKDKEAKVSLFTKKELFMETKSLYCKDPKATQRALMIEYIAKDKPSATTTIV